MIWGSRGFFSSPKCQDLFWGPPILLLNGYWGSLPGLKCWGVKLTTHLHLVPRLRISGVELLHLYVFMVWKGKKLPYFVEEDKTSFLNDVALYVVSSQLMHVKCPKWQFCLRCILLRTCILQCTVTLLSQFCCDIINIKTGNWIFFYSFW